MMQAFKAVKRNRGAAGVDKVSVQMFESNLKENLDKLMRQLKTRGGFQPRPLRRVHIEKAPGSGKTRPLGIPVVRDRVAQEVVRRLLAPIFEPLFHPHSVGLVLKFIMGRAEFEGKPHGFIKGRNCHMAIAQALQCHEEGYLVVLDADIAGFFDNIPHKTIMDAVAWEVADGNILGLVQRFLTAGVMEDGVFKPTTVGTPQGGVISPLLANIVLNQLDWQMHEHGLRFVRYADDFVVICQTKRQAQEALNSVNHHLQQLGLSLSAEKTHITTYGKGYEFLGFFLSSRSRRMRDKSVRKFKDKIREITVRHHNLDKDVVEKLNRVIRGTANYFTPQFATTRWTFQKLDSWIRMRLRCMKYKRKRSQDNRRLRTRTVRHSLGLLTLEEFCKGVTLQDVRRLNTPRNGATLAGVAQ